LRNQCNQRTIIDKEESLNETTARPFRPAAVVYIVAAFAAGVVFAGLFFNRQRSVGIGELDTRYNQQLAGAAETIGRLAAELERERGINQELRERNARAGELVEGLAGTALRNVRNLQDAVSIIGEIRKKLAVLENFYADSGSNGSPP
jgi:hypothetical protein